MNMEINHDSQREIEVQRLCKGVLSASTLFYDNPNGGYENQCPFCLKLSYGSNKKSWLDIEEISHLDNCVYLIAKDLSTNLK